MEDGRGGFYSCVSASGSGGGGKLSGARHWAPFAPHGGCCTVRQCRRGCPLPPPTNLACMDLISTGALSLWARSAVPIAGGRCALIHSTNISWAPTVFQPLSEALVGTVISFNPYNNPLWWDSCGFPAEEGARDQRRGISLTVTARKWRVGTPPPRFDPRGHAPQNNTWDMMVAKGAPEDPYLPLQGQGLL